MTTDSELDFFIRTFIEVLRSESAVKEGCCHRKGRCRVLTGNRIAQVASAVITLTRRAILRAERSSEMDNATRKSESDGGQI